jgi:hypothetical protein
MSSDTSTPFPGIRVYGHGSLGPPPGLASLSPDGAGVIIRERGCELVLHFDSPKPGAALLELRIGPERGKQLEPAKARQLFPQIELYMAAARAALSWNPDADADDFRAAADALREVGRPGRGLSDDFFRLIAQHHKALVSEGEKHPVKALSDIHHVTISAASRWVTEARRRGLIDTKEATHAR